MVELIVAVLDSVPVTVKCNPFELDYFLPVCKLVNFTRVNAVQYSYSYCTVFAYFMAVIMYNVNYLYVVVPNVAHVLHVRQGKVNVYTKLPTLVEFSQGIFTSTNSISNSILMQH